MLPLTRRESLERMTQRAGLAARTPFAGEFDRSALPDVYASADALIFTSTSETQGLVLVEALATGLPVVAVDSPQTRDVLGEFGAVAAADPAALAAALAQTLARDLNRARISQVTAERGEAEALAAQLQEALAQVEKALRKIEQDTYGTCERCAKPISPPRLEAQPATALCIECASVRR